jgi:hypothetical protein
MELTIHVPDDMLESVKEKLPPPEMGVLEAVALDAVLGFLLKLGGSGFPQAEPRGQK